MTTSLLLVLLSACTDPAGSGEIRDLTATTAELAPTATTVTFSSTEAGVGWVEVASSLGTSTTLPGTSGTEHTAVVVGVPPLSEVTLRAVVEVNGVQVSSNPITHTTGQLLPEAPSLEVVINNYVPPAGSMLLMSTYAQSGSVALIDFTAGVLWSLAPEDEGYCSGVLPVSGGLMCNHYLGQDWSNPTLLTLSWTGETTESQPLPDSHHFFTFDADGELIWLASDTRKDAELGVVIGDQIMRGRAGESVFSTWDDLTWPASLSADDIQGDFDWTHANWLEYNPDRGTYLLSMAYIEMILELDGDFTPVRSFRGMYAPNPGYSSDKLESGFRYPHGPHWVGADRLAVFSTAEGLSEVLFYTVDDANQQLHLESRFGGDYGYEAMVLGEIQLLPDGNLLISWGSVGILQVISPEHEVLWEAHTGLESFPSQVHFLTSASDMLR